MNLEQLNSKEMQTTIILPEKIRERALGYGVKLDNLDAETIGQLKFNLDKVEKKISSLREEIDKDRRSIRDDKNMELKDKVFQLEKFDKEIKDAQSKLSPLFLPEQQRNKIKTQIETQLEQQRAKIEGSLNVGGHVSHD